MKSFQKGQTVKFKTDKNEKLRGRITCVSPNGKTIRVVDKDGKRYTTSSEQKGTHIRLKTIHDVQFGVFVLDTRLDRDWTSRRQSARFWEEYCYHAEWGFASERVHSITDLNYILGKRTIKEHHLIISCHGSENGLLMSNGDCVGQECQLKVHPANHNKIVILSSCSVGANEKLCANIRDQLHAEAVVAYTTEVWDPICFLAESALLQLLATGLRVKDAVTKVADAMDPWKTLNNEGAKKFPLVCHGCS